MRKRRYRELTKPYVLNSAGREVSDEELLRIAAAEAEVWAAKLKAGKTAEDRNQPVCSSGCRAAEVAVSHLPRDVRIALEDELYAVDPGE